jgi:hypothetical protein
LLLRLLRLWWAFVLRLWLWVSACRRWCRPSWFSLRPFWSSPFRSGWGRNTFAARLLLCRSRRTLSLCCACWAFRAWLFRSARLFYALLTALLLSLFLLSSTCFAL